MYLTGTHPCATDVSFRRSSQDRRKSPGDGRARWRNDAATVRDLMSAHRQWQGPTHNSSKAQGGMKAAEDNVSEGGKDEGVAIGSQNGTCTACKTVQASTRNCLIVAGLAVKTILSQVYMLNPLAGCALTDRGLHKGSHPKRLPIAWPYQPATTIEQANLCPGQNANGRGHSRSPKPAFIAARCRDRRPRVWLWPNWPVRSALWTATLG